MQLYLDRKLRKFKFFLIFNFPLDLTWKITLSNQLLKKNYWVFYLDYVCQPVQRTHSRWLMSFKDAVRAWSPLFRSRAGCSHHCQDTFRSGAGRLRHCQDTLRSGAGRFLHFWAACRIQAAGFLVVIKPQVLSDANRPQVMPLVQYLCDWSNWNVKYRYVY